MPQRLRATSTACCVSSSSMTSLSISLDFCATGIVLVTLGAEVAEKIRYAMPSCREKVELDEDTAAAISAVSQSSTGALRIKMHNKLAALVVLGKYLGMFDERPQNSNVIYAISDEPMSAEEWKKQFVKAG